MNKSLATTGLEKTKKPKLPRLTKLNLKQLKEISGGPAGDGCPWCIYSP
ncbi:MAG: hypothetical protein AB4372_21155 [Xenococcus sp. (in: cyanobacteria)]